MSDTIETIPSAPAPDARSLAQARQGQLMWLRFRRHKLALAGAVVTLLIYLVVLLAEFVAPFTPDHYKASYTYAPPQALHLVSWADGGLRWAPHVKGYKVELDYAAGRRNFVTDEAVEIPVGFFVQGQSYRFWGLFESRLHLIAPLDSSQPMYLLGADRLGRDVLSRMVYGARVSMSIGLIGVVVSLFLGIILGGISGYYGGMVDNVIQRVIEFLQSLPAIPLWIGLAAAIPADVPPLHVYFFITLILSVLGWTGLARAVRGRFLALKSEDFVKAARLDGCGTPRIILRHMLPSFLSHVIAVATLAVPGMILAETALSFLGIGLRPPTVSWGVLLFEAQNIRSLSQAPWLLWPGACVVVAVLSMNFFGDGLRDAADPYA